MVSAVLRAEARGVVAGRGGDHVLDGRVAGCRRVSEMSGRGNCFRREIRLARPGRRQRPVVNPDTGKDASRVACRLPCTIAEYRASRDTLAVLYDAVQPVS